MFRVIKKFIEHDYAKLQVLIKIFEDIYTRISKINGDYLEKLDHGLFLLQRIAIVIGLIASAQDKNIYTIVETSLLQFDLTFSILIEIFQEHLASLNSNEETNFIRGILHGLINTLNK